MSAQHTPGRLAVSESGKLYVQGGQQFADTIKIHRPWVEDAWDGDPEADANMRRLAACWNACGDVPTDLLEEVQELGKATMPYRILQAQHAELMAAVRAILFQVVQGKVLERDACISQARAAYAKASGGST